MWLLVPDAFLCVFVFLKIQTTANRKCIGQPTCWVSQLLPDASLCFLHEHCYTSVQKGEMMGCPHQRLGAHTVQSMPSLLTHFGLSHCTVVIISDPKQQKGVSTKSHNRKPSPPFGILWEKEVQREDKASIHPDFLALRSTLEGKGCVMVIEP